MITNMITNNINSIINYNYFCLNFRHDFIVKCWQGDEHLINHLTEKFNEHFQRKGTALFPFFFADLDMENQQKLANWINTNYIAFEHLKE